MTRRVDDNIQQNQHYPAVDQRLRQGRVQQVRGHGLGVSEIVRKPLQFGLPPPADDEGHPRLPQIPGDGGTDSTGGSGDHGYGS